MLTKCSICGKFFGATDDEDVCDSCKIVSGKYEEVDDLEDLLFHETRNYVYDTPNASPEDVIAYLAEKGLSITRKIIMDYVRNGLIVLTSMDGKATCEDCGRTILSGRFCPTCTRKKESNLGVPKPVKKPVEPEKNKTGMHTKKD